MLLALLRDISSTYCSRSKHSLASTPPPLVGNDSIVKGETMLEVTAAIIHHNGKILIARRPAGDPLAGKWEFPGGKIEQGETPAECLQREIKEELGITILVGDFFADSIYAYPAKTVHLQAYFAAWSSGEIELRSHDAIAWATPADLKQFDFAPADIPFVNKLQMVLTLL